MTLTETIGWLIVAALTIRATRAAWRRHRDRAPDSAEPVVVTCGHCHQDIAELLAEVTRGTVAMPLGQAIAIAQAHDCPALPNQEQDERP